LESAINCDLALIVCDATGEFDMQMQTTLQTLREMDFSSPYHLVMNKSEGITDHSILPSDGIAISAKENVGISSLTQAILQKCKDEYLFCKLFVPYVQMHAYNSVKQLLIERHSKFTDDGQEIDAVIPSYYADKFHDFIVKN
jgi:50S ribosomal subunit-associated GTPase HflX